MKGIILVKPHGDLLLGGKKKLIIKPEDPGSSCAKGEQLIIVQGSIALGEGRLIESKPFSRSDFAKTKKLHRISDNEIKRWWRPDSKFWSLSLEITEKYNPPKRVVRERSAQSVVQMVIFKDKEYYDVMKRIFQVRPRDYTNRDLLQVHRLLHIFYERKDSGERVVIEGKPRSREDLINRHVRITEEMKRRGFEHNDEEDELNRLSARIGQTTKDNYLPVHPSGKGDGNKNIRIEDIFRVFGKPLLIQKGAVVFTGGTVNNGTSDNDLEVLFRLPGLEDIMNTIRFRLSRAVPDGHPMKDRLHFLGNNQGGPFTSHIEGFDLALIPGDQRIIRMALEEQDLDVVKQRAASEAVRDEANRSKKEDKVQAGRFFLAMKPTKGAKPEERQTVANFLSLFSKEDFPVYSSKKYDGARHLIIKKGKTVRIMSEDGDDNTERFPKAIALISNMKSESFILDAEAEMWEDGKHLPREAVAGYINAKTPPEDEDKIVFNVFDVLELNGEDLHTKTLEVRLKQLESVLKGRQSTAGVPDTSKIINLIPHTKADNIDELKAQTRKVTDTPGSEGNVAKKAKSTYYLDGNSREGWIKFHKSAVLVGRIIQAIETETPGTFNYRFGLALDDTRVNPKSVEEAKGKEVLEVGKTFSTSLKGKEGENIEVEFETLNWSIDKDGTVEVSAWAPRVMSIGDTGDFDTIKEARSKASEADVLQVKEETEEGAIIYKALDHLVKQRNPYMIIPSEKGKYKYSIQHHYRGRSAHADLRIENDGGEFLIGWTLADLVPGEIKKPVETLARGKIEDKRNDNWKIDWKKGLFKKRETRGGNIVRAQIRAFEKAPEPKQWLNVEGVTQPFPAPGATRRFRGVFSIIDRGRAEYLAQKLDFHEYFMSQGILKGRLSMRRLARESLKQYYDVDPDLDLVLSWQHYFERYLDEFELVWGERIQEDGFWLSLPDVVREDKASIAKRSPVLSKILPPAVAEAKPLTTTFWTAIQPEDQTPIVISSREVKKGWMPPDGISALPQSMRERIPSKYRYWNLKGKAAQKVRDDLVKNLDEVLKQRTTKYVLQFRGFRTPGKKPVRGGFTEMLWDFRVDREGPKHDDYEMQENPLTAKATSATLRVSGDSRAFDFEGQAPPGHPLNPTKATAATVEKLSEGRVVVLEESPTFRKYDVKAGKMKGLWVASRDDTKTPIWKLERSALPRASKGDKK